MSSRAAGRRCRVCGELSLETRRCLKCCERYCANKGSCGDQLGSRCARCPKRGTGDLLAIEWLESAAIELLERPMTSKELEGEILRLASDRAAWSIFGKLLALPVVLEGLVLAAVIKQGRQGIWQWTGAQAEAA